MEESLLKKIEELIAKIMSTTEDVAMAETALDSAAYVRARKKLIQIAETDISKIIVSMDILFPQKKLRIPDKHVEKAAEAMIKKYAYKEAKKRKRPPIVGGVIVSMDKKKYSRAVKIGDLLNNQSKNNKTT